MSKSQVKTYWVDVSKSKDDLPFKSTVCVGAAQKNECVKTWHRLGYYTEVSTI